MVYSSTKGLINVSETSIQSSIAGVSKRFNERIVGVSNGLTASISGVSANINNRIAGVSRHYAKVKPRRVRQAKVPTPNLRELVIWSRVSGDYVYLVYNDPLIGVVKKQLL